MDDAADLDDDPQTWDPADVVNMSLGSYYGQPEDDLTWFSNQAADYGMIVVASAGNDNNKPFIVGSPSTGDGVISVAQTATPSTRNYPLTVDYRDAAVRAGQITIYNSRLPALVGFAGWRLGPVSGTLVYGNADGTNKNGCAPYTTAHDGHRDAGRPWRVRHFDQGRQCCGCGGCALGRRPQWPRRSP